jgi:glutathione S-transferase
MIPAMMILRSAPASPFGRKVKVTALVLGLTKDIEVHVADTMDAGEPLRQQNPLGKIPTLILESGETLYDSRVIVEYLDDRAGGGIVIPKGPARWSVLRGQSLADGIMDAAILQIYENRFRDESRREARWVEHQAGKVARGLAAFAAAPPAISAKPDIAAIGLACTLGYLDFRFAGHWRTEHPGLVGWFESFSAALPGFADTAPH